MFKLAFRNLFRHKLRTGITLAAVAFGVTALILSGGFVKDIFVQLGEFTIHSQLGHIQIYKSGYYRHGRADPYRYLIDKPEVIAREITKLPHVAQVMARLQFSGVLNNGRADLPILGEGVEPDKETTLDSAITWLAGRALKDSDGYGIVLGEGVARALQLKPGDYATLLLNTPGGALNSMEFKVVGIFRTIGKDYDNHAVRITLPAAQDLLSTPTVHSLVLSLDETSATAEVAARLKLLLLPKGYEVKTWDTLSGFYDKAVALYTRYFGVMRIIILVMVLLSVLNSITLAVHERTGEYGTLMALGNHRSDLFRLIVVENSLIGLFGSAIGVVTGVLLAKIISVIGIPMPPPPNMSGGYTAIIRVTQTTVWVSVLIGISAALLAALLAAGRSARLPIVDALRHNI